MFKILTVNVMTKERTDRLTSLFKILISILSFSFQTQSSSPKKSAKRPPPPSSSSSDLSSSDSSSESDDGKTGSQKVVLYCLILQATGYLGILFNEGSYELCAVFHTIQKST